MKILQTYWPLFVIVFLVTCQLVTMPKHIVTIEDICKENNLEPFYTGSDIFCVTKDGVMISPRTLEQLKKNQVDAR